MNASLFDRLEAGCRETGKGFADHIIRCCPPPWEEGSFKATVEELLQEVAGHFLGKARPDLFSDAFIQQMQLAAFEGFNARLRAVVEASGREGGQS